MAASHAVTEWSIPQSNILPSPVSKTGDSSTGPSDEALVEAAKNGDTNAFETLIELSIKSSGWIVIASIVLIFIFVGKEAVPLLTSAEVHEEVTIGGMVLPREGETLEEKFPWQPVSTVPKYALLPLLLGTLKVTFVALLLAIPIALGAAIDYLDAIGMEAISAWEHELLEYATEQLQKVPGLRIIGTARHKAAVVSFVLEGVHPHDIGTILDREGIAVRTGHHCAQPVMQRYGVPATARASVAFYNTREDVDALVAGLHRVLEVLG